KQRPRPAALPISYSPADSFRPQTWWSRHRFVMPGVRLVRKDPGQSNSDPNQAGLPAWFVLGRVRVRSGRQAWGEEAPFHTPGFVVTHEKRDPWERLGETTFHF